MDVNVLVAQAGMDPPGISAVESRLAEVVSPQSDFLKNITDYVLKAGGKRLRPALVLICSAFKNCSKKELVDAAVVMELIHMASLIHDDIIDCSDMRHGCGTVNMEYGNLSAVLTGDYFFATAFNILVTNKQYEVLKLVTGVIREMCEGEIEQASSCFDYNQTEEIYMERIRKKTAGLIASCCQAGALISNLNEAQVMSMREYGLNIGYAYQIIDDILDYTGKQDLGKPVFSDLSQGLLTLPVIYLIRDEKYGLRWKKLLKQKRVYEKYMYEIGDELLNSGAIEYSYKLAKRCLENAKESLRLIPSCRAKKVLIQLTEILYSRIR